MKVTARDAVEVVGVVMFVGGFWMELTVGIAMIACGSLILFLSCVGRLRS